MTDKYRVRRLLRKVDLTNASVKKWAVVRLLDRFPDAKYIRFAGKCDFCKRGQYLMSFQLPFDFGKMRHDSEENCGYYCPSCRNSNAGSREVWTRKLGRPR